MHRQLLVVGAGIGGLAAALAAARRGWQVRVLEQAPVFGEIGAGLQLGPNATRILQAWGLEPSLAALAAFPDRLVSRSAVTGEVLGTLALGDRARMRYGAPYATLHRADLHGLLAGAAREAGVVLREDARVTRVLPSQEAVSAFTERDDLIEADALVAADGIWSATREQLLGDGPAIPTGHVAHRALVAVRALPAAWRGSEVTVWLGPRLHAVVYPVRAGTAMNVVVVQARAREGTDALRGWDHGAAAAELESAIAGCAAPLRDFIAAVNDALKQPVEGHADAGSPGWRLWWLYDRAPLSGAAQMARGRIALLGDAAHPMRPYLAQGAAMAIEDAEVLAGCLALCPEIEVREALARYAALRWSRVARVQRRAARNGEIFHLDGWMARARDLSLRAWGDHLMDAPWLYGHRL